MKQILSIIISTSFLIAFSFCGRQSDETLKDKDNQNSCLTKYPKDSADYKFIKCNFYIGKDGELYKKKIEIDKFDPPYCNSVFFDKYFHKHYDDSIVDIPLSSIIDINSYTCFDSSSYSKDKSKCFYYYDNSDGGFINIIDTADVKTFQPLSYSWWAKDKNFVYYRGGIVIGADPISFKLINDKTTEALDKNHKYRDGEIIK